MSPLSSEKGDILFFAECPDGHGDDAFYKMMIRYKSPQEVIDNFKKEKFKMGGHKAFLWCRSLIKARVYLYSSIGEELSRILIRYNLSKRSRRLLRG
jgi:nickel-dependent lactate racemase